jgi:hypothetical protein
MNFKFDSRLLVLILPVFVLLVTFVVALSGKHPIDVIPAVERAGYETVAERIIIQISPAQALAAANGWIMTLGFLFILATTFLLYRYVSNYDFGRIKPVYALGIPLLIGIVLYFAPVASHVNETKEISRAEFNQLSAQPKGLDLLFK